jgi:stress response protein YsnF
MTLSGTNDFSDRDQQLASNKEIYDFDVYSGQNEKIGKVVKIEMAGLEQSPHLVVKVGSWLSSKQVLLALHSHRVDFKTHRVYINGWSREQVNQLPSYSSQVQIESAYAVLETSTPLESQASLEAPFVRRKYSFATPVGITDSFQRAPSSVSIEDNTAQLDAAKVSAEEVIPLLAERVIVDRHKRKSGEIVIRKVIETEVIEVLVRREKLIVEQVSPEYKELAVIDLGQMSAEEKMPSQTQNGDL